MIFVKGDRCIKFSGFPPLDIDVRSKRATVIALHLGSDNPTLRERLDVDIKRDWRSSSKEIDANGGLDSLVFKY